LMTRSNWQEIRRRSAGSDVYLDGTFVDHQSGEVIYNVGIRYRGNGSRNPPDDRHNYRVRFGDDRKFNGLKRLNFNSQNVQRQHLGNDAFRRAGVPCSVTVPAVLRFDQTTDALYVRLEAYDEDFLDRVFGGDDEGNLYRGMNGRLDYRGEDPGDYDGNYRKVTNEEENDFSDLIALTRAFSTADEEEFAAEVSARIDVYEWILYFAANSALGNNENSILLDAGDDYYLYSRPSDGRFLILPWDCDSLLVDAQQALFRPSAAAIARLLRHPLYAPYYYCELDRLHADVVSPEAIYPRLARAAALYTDDQVQGVEDFVWNRGDYLDARIPRSIEVDPHRTSRLTLVAAGDEWSYWKGTSHPSGGDLSWTEIGFDDSEWPVGPSGFGYGDGDDATLLDDMQGSYSTVFIRRRFAAGDVSGVLALFLSVDYDDGFVAYLNGAEIARSNYNPEIPDHNDTAARDHEAGTAQEFAVADGPQILHEGENVLAIVAFNGSLDSSDVSIIPALEATLSGEDLGCGECAQQTTQSRFELSGRAPGCATYTVLVNGVEARYVPWQAAWDITVDLLPGENRFEIEALDLALNTTDFRAVTIHRGGTVQPLPSSITGILRLTPDEGPYRLSGDVLVEAGGELRIEAGARVYLEPSAHLRVEGSFSARGTEELAVRISAADCASGGGAITIDGAAGASSALFEHCEITGGGVSGGGRIRVIDGAAEIRDCLFRDILGFAVEAVRSEVRVERTIIAASAGGLLASASRLAVGSVDLVDTAEGIRADGGEVRIDGARVKGAATGVRLAGGSHRLSRLLVHASTLGLDILAGTGLAADHLTIAGNRTGVQNASTPGTGADEVSIDSSIIWANRTGRAGAGQAAFSYCDVQDGSPAGEGNISFDPSFADASRGDYRLLPGSPARGSGRDGSDMGTYAASESPPQFIRGDADDSGQVNLTDSVFTLM
ncbi:MAG: CotH kinase family protein, partial [Planctomycetes bacterium]|nr:CotH kinase family protein [Planctomycetota bacterium]